MKDPLTLCIIICFSLFSCSELDINKEYEKGMKQFESKNYSGAISTFTIAIEASDTCGRCYEYRSHSYKLIGQYDKALSDMEILIEGDPNNPFLYASRASLHYEKNEYEKALRDFRKALDLKSDFVEMYNPISHMLFITKRKNEACEFYKKALEVGENEFNEEIVDYCSK